VSGFSAGWLALREPADQAARNPELLASLEAIFSGRKSLSIVDLGCGTGSNLRACAARLAPFQRWTLVDHDPALLAAARETLSRWADSGKPSGEELRLRRDGKQIAVRFRQADLATELAPILDGSPDLVTAAALFDLVSPVWLEKFAAEVSRHQAVLYTALTYDGTERWTPVHAADQDVIAAFHAHQSTDKGFGPAAGPRATAILEAAFRAVGYEVRSGPSPWRLGPESSALIRELAEGGARAARETGLIPEASIRAWLEARREAAACEIGHLDLLARPAR
jgi:SAM-dependent methyltransferase